MKTFSKLLLLSAPFALLSSCQKQTLIPTPVAVLTSQEMNETAGDCIRNWNGLYANEIETNDTIGQRSIIKNGVAQLPPVTWYNYHTGLYYDIPQCHKLCGDSIRFEARIKNPNNIEGSVFDYEVALQLFGGDKLYAGDNYAEIYFTSSSTMQSYTHMWIGDLKIADLPEFVHYFGEYETIAIEIKNQTLSVYREGQLVKSLPYDSHIKLKELKRIGVGFKGSGITDWVKLYNSYTGEQIMQEDFDVDGHSNVQWF